MHTHNAYSLDVLTHPRPHMLLFTPSPHPSQILTHLSIPPPMYPSLALTQPKFHPDTCHLTTIEKKCIYCPNP